MKTKQRIKELREDFGETPVFGESAVIHYTMGVEEGVKEFKEKCCTCECRSKYCNVCLIYDEKKS